MGKRETICLGIALGLYIRWLRNPGARSEVIARDKHVSRISCSFAAAHAPKAVASVHLELLRTAFTLLSARFSYCHGATTVFGRNRVRSLPLLRNQFQPESNREFDSLLRVIMCPSFLPSNSRNPFLSCFSYNQKKNIDCWAMIETKRLQSAATRQTSTSFTTSVHPLRSNFKTEISPATVLFNPHFMT